MFRRTSRALSIPANRPEELGARPISDEIERQGFRIDVGAHTITRPAGQVESFDPGGDTIRTSSMTHGLRDRCCRSARGSGPE